MPQPGRIGVLTFHRCINYGSHWQARALVEGLRRNGREALLLDHHSRAAERAEARNVFQPTRPVRTARGDYAALAEKTRRFAAALSRLPLSRRFSLEEPQAMEPQDVALIGSDEVWNFAHPWYAAKPAFFGDGLTAKRLVAYAASFGCHGSRQGLDAFWSEKLRRFDALSVRDENSRDILKASLGQDAPLTLDPCLLFADLCRRETTGDDVALVYGHGFPAAFVAGVRRWARRRGVQLVSIGYRNDWADAQDLAAGPDAFAEAMGAARAVITNYFHGCVFALLNDKPFACTLTDYRRHKIVSLLKALDAADRILLDDAEQRDFDRALDQAPQDGSRRRLAALRAQSHAFLGHALA